MASHSGSSPKCFRWYLRRCNSRTPSWLRPTPLAGCVVVLCSGHMSLPSAPPAVQATPRFSHRIGCSLFLAPSQHVAQPAPAHHSDHSFVDPPMKAVPEPPIKLGPQVSAPTAPDSPPGHTCYYLHICNGFPTAYNPRRAGMRRAHTPLPRFKRTAVDFQQLLVDA